MELFEIFLAILIAFEYLKYPLFFLQNILSSNQRVRVFYQKTILNNHIYNSLYDRINSYNPCIFAPGPYAQTILSNLSKPECIKYTRTIHYMRDHVPFALDWKLGIDTSIIVVVCHGIGGSSASPSCIRITDALVNNGLSCVVYNRRGHVKGLGLLSKTKAFPIHADMQDMNDAISEVAKMYPMSKIALVGISAGANLCVKFLNTPEASKLTCCVSISNGLELIELTHSFSIDANALMVSSLRGVLKQNILDIKQIAYERNIKIDFDELVNKPYINVREFERKLMLPFYPEYKNHIDEYYSANSSIDSLLQTQIPTLCLTAIDDILISKNLVLLTRQAAEKNNKVISIITSTGGHLGWSTNTTNRKYNCWASQIVCEYIRLFKN